MHEKTRESKQTRVSQVFRDDDICDRVEDKFNVPSISGTCGVRVDGLSLGVLVQPDKHVSDVVDASLVCIGTCTKGKRK